MGFRRGPSEGRDVGIEGRIMRAVLKRGAEGTQLLEFALLLPVLVVLVVGAADFGRGYNLKQKLTNAAREGARIAIGQSPADLTQTVPSTVQAVRNAVVTYLSSENLDTSFISATPTQTGTRQWTYASTATGAPILVIDRGYTVPVNVGGTVTLAVSTRVALSYPFSWTFARVARLLVSTANYQGSFLISTEVVMKNLT